jgi:hypothetical protein
MAASEPIQSHDVVVHKFRMGDVEDPDLYAAEPLYQWQESEMGKWVMEHALEVPMWNRTVDTASFGHLYYITARLAPKDYTYWSLKWGCLTK